MSKTFKIAWHTYSHNVRRGSFLFLVFGFPLAYATLGLAGGLIALNAIQADSRPIGYVDMAGVLIDPADWQPAAPLARIVDMRSFADETSAKRALEAGEIRAFYLLDKDYVNSGNVIEYSAVAAGLIARSQFEQFLRDSLLAQIPASQRPRLARGTTILHRSLDDHHEFTAQHYLNLGVVWGLLFTFALVDQLTNSYMLTAFTEEHANSTAEIMFTSATADQLLAGKIGGLVALGLTPLFVWGAAAGAGLWLVLTLFRAAGQDFYVTVPWGLLALSILMLIPAYVMNATLTAIIGSLTGITGQGQGYQIASILDLAQSLAWSISILIVTSAPDTITALVLSLAPLTSAFVLPARLAQLSIPPWQIILSIALLWGTMLISVAVSARLYRAAWLINGQKNRLRALFLALKGQ